MVWTWRAIFGVLLLVCRIKSTYSLEDGEEMNRGACLGRGFKNVTTGACECANGFHGYECQFRYCPFGPSWNSVPLASHVRNTENVACSNMGDCNRMTGVCECRPGFEGRACERMACPGRPFRSIPDKTISYPVDTSTDVALDGGMYFSIGQGAQYDLPPFEDGSTLVPLRRASVGVTAPCSGHGICRSMREAGMDFNGHSLVRPWVYYDQWDADKIQGCLCDRGWEGYDCSYRACPKGRDPYDPNRAHDKDESYTMECQADSGYFALNVWGETTIPISFDAGPEYIRRALKELKSTKGDISVIMQENNDGLPTVCDATYATRTTFSFSNMAGKLPPIRLVKTLAASRQLQGSATALGLTGGTESSAMVSVYTITCGQCVDCFGNIHFTYGDSVSASVDATATGAASAIKAAIEAMSDFSDSGWPEVDVVVSVSGGTDAVCQAAINTVTIDIKSTIGNVQGLEMKDGVYSNSLVYVTKGFSNYGQNLSFVSPSGNGTLYECSNQGRCDSESGRCMCDSKNINSVPAFRAGSSDGTTRSDIHNNRGAIGDCSHVELAENYGCAYSLNSSNPSHICGGHGTCDTAANLCRCDPGWGGAECEHYTCPKDYPFFSEPVSATKARQEKEECSGQGYCDRGAGLCRCRSGFVGPACQVFDCPRDAVSGEECNGQGYCENLYDTYSLFGFTYGKLHGVDPQRPHTWDAVRIRQCLCYGKRSDDHYAHPLRPAVAPKTGVGRWETGGRPVAGFGGWKCHNRMCPRGHSKMYTNTNQLMYSDESAWPMPRAEIIRVVCTLNVDTESSIYFTLLYYGFQTGPIYPTYTAAEIKRALEAHPSIGNVTVAMDREDIAIGRAACDSTGVYTTGTGFTIRFDTEGGNHPTPTVTVSDSSKAGDLAIAVVQEGNSENEECGGDKQGYCDYGKGLCMCKPGRGSSDLRWGIGDIGDCGYRHEG